MPHSPIYRKLIRLLQRARTPNQSISDQSTFQTIAKQTLTRRRFLRYSTLAAGVAIAATSSCAPSKQAPNTQFRIAIIGAGIAGLNAAYQLKKLGFTATVYEAKRDIGGRIQSRSGLVENELINDLGGCFINSDHDDMLALADELNVALFPRFENLEPSSVPETAYYYDGRRIPEAEVADDLRELAIQIGDDAALLDEDFDTYAEIFDRQSVADYLDRHADKIPVPYVRALVEAGIRTEYGVEPAESSALQLLYNLPTVSDNVVEPLASDEMFYVKEGSGTLIDRLAAQLDDQIHTQWPLRQISETADGSFQLTFERNGQPVAIEADYVILATSFKALRAVDLQVDLPETLRRFIDEVDLGHNEKLFAGFHDRSWRQETGFSLEAWTDLGFAHTWEEPQRQPDKQEGVLTLYLSGREVFERQLGTQAQGQQLLERMAHLSPGLSKGKSDRFYRTDWSNDPYIGGSYINFKPGQYLEFSEFLYIESDDPEERVDVHVGNLVFAGEHLSDEFYGYMNGGAQTGRLAAEVVTSRMAVRE